MNIPHIVFAQWWKTELQMLDKSMHNITQYYTTESLRKTDCIT